MTERELLAGAREFVERTFRDVDGRVPSKKAVNSAAKKIAETLRDTSAAAKPRQTVKA